MQLSLQTQSSSDAVPSSDQEFPLARRNRLICETMWLVGSLAWEILRVHAFSISREDLESCGMRGLVHAADAFDHRAGTRFSTFAYYRIRGVMLDAVRDGFGQCTRTEMSRMRELAQLRDADAGGRRASDGEPLERLTKYTEDLPETGVARSLREHAASPEEIVERIDASDRVREAIAALPARPRQVLELLYYEYEGSFEAVAQRLGMTRPHIFRIHARALRQLRAALAELAP
jgi:RNA polymerase sigma factor for flagellar operon FliA